MTILYNNNFKTLDLHGETKDVARLLVKQFIDDNIIMKNRYLAIICGNGEVLKKEVINLLKNHKKVASFNIDIYNPGRIVIFLDLKNDFCYNNGHIRRGGI